jgi:hypothetical protein
MIDSVKQDADFLNAVASDSIKPDETYSVGPANSTSWTTTTALWSGDVTVDVWGNRGVCVAPVVSNTIGKPTCEVSITDAVYNISDGTVTTDWQFLIDNAVGQAEILNATATDGGTTVAWADVDSNVSSTSWTTVVPFVNDVTVTVGGYNGVCVAPTNSVTIAEPQCEVLITSALYNVVDGTVTVDWEYMFAQDGVSFGPQDADTLSAIANSVLDGVYDTYSGGPANSTSWTSSLAKPFTNDVAVDVDGQYGVCLATNSTTIDVPQCSINIASATANADGTVTVDWTFLRDEVPQNVDSLSLITNSATDPDDGTTYSGVNSDLWTSGVRYTDEITVTLDGNYGVCAATNSTTVTETSPTCVIVVNSPSYDIDTGKVSVDWEFWLNGSAYVANSMIVNADSGIPLETDTTTILNSPSGIYSWTTGTAFTNDVTMDFTGRYSTTCDPITNSVTVDVPACSVEFVNGPAYNIDLLDGSVDTEWKFLIDGLEAQAGILNAVAYYDGLPGPEESYSDALVNSTSWKTSTNPWPNDVTVEIGGKKGVCVAPALSNTISRPACWVDIFGEASVSNGAVSLSWEFMVDGAPHIANILNAVAYNSDDRPDSYFFSPANVNGTTWTTTSAFTNKVTIDVGAEFGRCQVTNTTTIAPVPYTCGGIINAVYDETDGSVDLTWQYVLDGRVYPAQIMNANAWNIVKPGAENAGFEDYDVASYAWDTATALSNGLFSNAVAVNIDATYGLCSVSNGVVLTRPICNATGGFYTDASFITNATYYDVPLRAPGFVNGNVYVEIRDCDENEDRYAVDTVTVDLSSDDAGGPLETEMFVLTEVDPSTGLPDPNSGVFRAMPTITRKAILLDGALLVNAGSFINGTYTDNDDPADTGTSPPIPITGCREISVTDWLGNPIGGVMPDAYPYNLAYPDGMSAFHVIVNAPAMAGGGIANVTMRTNSCEFNPLTLNYDIVDDTHSVTLRENPADNGMFTIDSSTYVTDYVYVGADVANVPAPGGNTDVGLRVAWDPEGLLASFPDFGATCEPWTSADLINFGCYSGLGAGEVCQRDLALGGSHSALLGTIGWGGACTSWFKGPSYYGRRYDFTLSQNTYVNIDVESPGSKGLFFDTELFLTGFVWEQDDDSGTGTNSRIRRWLPAGNYTIEATSFNMFDSGDFKVTLTNAAAACPLIPINVGDSVASTTNANCGATQWTDPSGEYYSEHYVLSVGVTNTVQFNVTGPMWPRMFIYDVTDPTQMIVLEWGIQSAILTLDPGKYIIEVVDTSFPLDTPYAYTLTLSDFDPAPINVGDINKPGVINGTQVSWWDPNNFAQFYEFTLGSGQVIITDMVNSPTLANPLLVLYDSDFNFIAWNDDINPPTIINASITQALGAGTYYIEATTGWDPVWWPGDTGAFEISLYADVPPTLLPFPSYNAPVTIDGTQASLNDPSNFAKYYTFTIGSGQVVNIEMVNSPTADPLGDPFIVLYDSDYNWIDWNDNCFTPPPAITNACMTQTLSAGTYIIEATAGWAAPWYPGDTGDSLLSIYPATATPINIGAPMTTYTLDTSQASPNNIGNYAKYFAFTVPVFNTVVIQQETTGAPGYIVDPYLYLLDSDYNVIAQNDNVGIGNNAGIGPTVLSSGTYYIEGTTGWVFPNPGETGFFDLTLSEFPMPPITNSYSFEVGFDGWSKSALPDDLWHQSTRAAAGSSAGALHYGLEEPGTAGCTLPGASCYDTGATNSGFVNSPVNVLMGGGGPGSHYLSFDYSRGTECGLGFTCGWDNLDVLISTDGGVFWQSLTFGTGLPDTHNAGDAPVFENRIIDISGYMPLLMSYDVMIRFSFDTGDAAFNWFEGAYVDNVVIF